MARPYNPKVRVGNWNEDVTQEEEMIKKFLALKEAGQLAMSVTEATMRASGKPVRLTKSGDGNLHFGDVVILKHEATGAALSVLNNPIASPADPVELTAAPGDTRATMRNAFTIAAVDPRHEDGDVVTYGDHVRLVARDAKGDEQQIFSEKATIFGGTSRRSGRQEVIMVSPYDSARSAHNAAFVFVYASPDMRFESEGTPVPVNQPILIKNVATNSNLAVLEDVPVRSEFGVEYDVACNNFLTPRKLDGPQNIFVLDDGGASSEE